MPGIGVDTMKDLYFTFGIKAALHENSIDVPSHDKETILKNIDNSLEIDNEIKKKVDGYVSKEIKAKKIKLKELKAKTDKVFEKLDLSSSKNKENFVKPSFDHLEILKKASQDKIESLENTQGLTANLSVNMMKSLGFTHNPDDGSFTGKGDVTKFVAALNDNAQGTLKTRLDSHYTMYSIPSLYDRFSVYFFETVCVFDDIIYSNAVVGCCLWQRLSFAVAQFTNHCK